MFSRANSVHAVSTPASPLLAGQHKKHYSSLIPVSTFASNASIVLVGIRGCGKRSLGFIAATALGRRFVTEDHFFQSVTGLSRQDYLKLHGSEEFHKHDVEISRRMLDDNKTGCVIDCGLGSLTSALQEHLKVYSASNPVIYIARDMAQIMTLLKLTDHSAKRLETVDPTHRRCSNYEYFNLEDSSNESTENSSQDRASPNYVFKLQELQSDFSHFVQLITGGPNANENIRSPFSPNAPLTSRLYTHAIQISFLAFCDGKIDLTKLESGGDVVEILVDQWQAGSVKALSRMVAEIRRRLRAPILITTIWSSKELSADTHFDVLRHGLRLAVEFLAVDPWLDTRQLTELRTGRGPTRLMASCRLESSHPEESVWLDGTAMSCVKHASSLGFDLIHLTHKALRREENSHVAKFLHDCLHDNSPDLCIIAYNTGRLGRTSQVFNSTLTSVTHEALRHLPYSTQNVLEQPCITSQEALQALFASFVLDPLDFCIIGGNVSQSLSPAMHNAAYKRLGLNHTYTTRNIKSWEDVVSLAQNSNFGGASIVQPWKVRLAGKVAQLSDHARIIGAINTLIPLRSDEDGKIVPLSEQAAYRNRAGTVAAWYGDNTDWVAMSTCIARSLSPRNVIQHKSSALVIGAGGMARSATYALLRLGVRNILVYNRTLLNAEHMVSHFNKWFAAHESSHKVVSPPVRCLNDSKRLWPAGLNLPTIVVSCVTHEHLEGNPDSNFTMPEQWLGSETGGVVLELAYMTRETPLTSQIKQFRQEHGTPWVVVDGIETLFGQALAQFEIMTGRPAPQRCMREAIDKAIRSRQTFVADGEEFEVV